MRILEIELGEIEEKKRVIKRLNKKMVIVNDFHRGWIEGRIADVSGKESYYLEASEKPATQRQADNGRSLLLNYCDAKQLLLINPDDLTASIGFRHSYQQITERTITETTKWARRCRT